MIIIAFVLRPRLETPGYPQGVCFLASSIPVVIFFLFICHFAPTAIFLPSKYHTLNLAGTATPDLMQLSIREYAGAPETIFG